MRTTTMLESMLRDLRYAVRNLARTPGFTFVALATLALGIGANTAIFSIVHAVLLEPLPYDEPHRLVRIYGVYPQSDVGNLNPLDVLDWREQNRSFEHIVVLHNSELTVAGEGETEPVRAAVTRVTHDFFSMLGVQPRLGRSFAPEEESVGSHEVAILTHGFWLSWFGGDPGVLSKSIRIGDTAYSIVGVLPPEFRTPHPGHYGEPAIYRPLALDPERTGRGGHFTQAFARLRPEVSLAQAQQEMNALTADLVRRFPDQKTGRSARLAPLTETIVGDYRKSLTVLMIAVGFVLLIACTNVASLFLARAASREREIAVRTAMGAGRMRIIRQLLTESLLVAVAGGAIAVALGAWLAGVLRTAGGAHVPRLADASIDPAVLSFTLAASIGSALLFGTLPAIHLTRRASARSLPEGGRSVAGAREVRRALRVMIVAEVALSIMLLTAAGLLMRSLWRIASVETGFDVDRLAFVRLQISPERYTEDARVWGFYEEIGRRLERHPQIAAAGATNILPFSGGHSCDGYVIEGIPDPPGAMGPCAEVRSVTATYFETMGIPRIAGRLFEPSDRADSAPVVLISRSMASRLGGNPVGRRLRTGRLEEDQWATIVGITEDVKHFGLQEPAQPEIYLLDRQAPYYGMTLVVRSRGAVESVMPIVRRELRELDPTLPLNRLEPMRELVGRSMGESRLRALLFGGFAAIALLLAAAGIYGVLSHGVANRTRELGVRMALGADQKRLRASILGESLRMTLLGLALGVLGALATARLIESLLFGVSAADPTTFVVVAALLVSVAVAASWIPARRATKVDPMVALRAE
ncbi:MAG TPA: ABC transporter permease [Thermoanaerobaculia bacterium]|nr:ABC transporter permease [Thermoanaerobaculia bacterium]